MLKHSDILEKLNALQKVAIVASVFGDAPFEQAGLPAAGLSLLGELAKSRGVSYGSAIRSWDAELVGAMTQELVGEGKKAGKKFFVTPDLKAAIAPAKEGLSEDGYLNGVFGAAMAKATHAAGAAAGLGRLSVGADEIAYLDRSEDAEAVDELFVKPFLIASEEPCEAIFSNPAREGTGYYETNRALFLDVQNGRFGENVFAAGEGETSSADAVKLLHGNVTLGGSTIPLERAIRRYAQLSAYADEGSVPRRDVEEALRDGSALDPEKLDEIVDAIVDLVLNLDAAEETLPAASEKPAENGENPENGENAAETKLSPVLPTPVQDAARRKAAEDCIVLLKNEGVLPLAAGSKVAVLGEAYGDLSALETKFTVVGRAAGYDGNEARSDALIPEAVRTASRADVALVFLYPDRTGRELALPANRIALLEALKKANRKVVALVCGDLPADMRFDVELAATLAVPADGPFAGEALARVLCGEVNPSGKLVRTCYDYADDVFTRFCENRNSGRMRVGAFVGYRRYDTAGEVLRYPFGYGIGYSKFEYSDLSVEGERVSFLLRNAGKYDGAEVAQIYFGAPAGTHAVPKKQLCAFRKVFLRAGESRRVEFTLPNACFSTYDRGRYTDNTEAGVYRIYVCASVLDIRLQGKRTVEGEKREPVAEAVADYYPNGDYIDVSNVERAHRMAAGADNAPERLKRIRRAVIYAFPVLLAATFILLTVLILSYALDYTLLSVAGEETVKWSVYAAAIVILAAIPLLGSLNRKRISVLRNVALVLFPLLIAVCFILGVILLVTEEEEGERIALLVVSCFTVGAPILASVAALVEQELERSKSGANRWEKFYMELEREERTTPELEFEEAFRTAEAAKTAVAETPQEQTPAVIAEAPRFYDRRLTYEQLIGDCRRFLEERGVVAEEEVLRNWIAAISSTQLIVVPKGDGATLCEAVAEYFGRTAYIDNAEGYRRYEDLYSQWKQGGRANVVTNLSVALDAARRETAYLHTALIRHISPSDLGTLFTPVADVLARRRLALPVRDGESVMFPPNLILVAEVEEEKATGLPTFLTEVAAVLSPSCGTCEPAPHKTVLQAVGYERFAAMQRSVRDDYPLPETLWKGVDALDGRCKSARIGNHLWVKAEVHASVVAACGGEAEQALDGALAAEVVPWFAAAWDESVCGESIAAALTEIFGKENIRLGLAAAGEEEDK